MGRGALDPGHRHLGPAHVDAQHGAHRAAGYGNIRLVDRRLANRNIRTALIAGLIALAVFAASFAAGFVY